MENPIDENLREGARGPETDKAIALFRFIRAISAMKQKTALNIGSHSWAYFLADIPMDPHNILTFSRDRVEEEAMDSNAVLLKVHKPEFTKCPAPDPNFAHWLEEDWDSFRREATVRETMKRPATAKPTDRDDGSEFSTGSEMTVESFDEDPERVKAYQKWLSIRGPWVEMQKVTERTRDFFTKLYQIHIDLERDSETLELIVANGFLKDKNDPEIHHPVLTRRVKMRFDASENTMIVEDTEVETELYSMLLLKMKDVSLGALSSLSDDLHRNDYHPLDRNGATEFLKILVHHLSSESIYSENGEPADWRRSNRLLMYFSPAFIMRKRDDGTLKAVEQIIRHICETGEVPPHVGDIVNGGKIDVPEPTEEELEEQLAAVGGESADILLSKEANKEQLEIAKRIEHYNAVLVQGPPGTGKTHTIANLMGHFLSQGKNVLVASHTKKALAVLKEKVAPGLQSLCVSVIDDSNADMEKSVDGISEYLSGHTSAGLKRSMDSTGAVRQKVIEDLAQTRRRLFELINQEYESITINGESITPSRAAMFVQEHSEDLSYIPGEVRLREPLPLTFSELAELYRSNELITTQEEGELVSGLPDPESILSPTALGIRLASRDRARKESEAPAKALGWTISSGGDCCFILKTATGSIRVCKAHETHLKSLEAYLAGFGQGKPWMKQAAIDGKRGGAYRRRWVTLTEQISKVAALTETVLSEQFGHSVQFSPDASLPQLVPVLEKLRDHLERKGKLGKLDLLLNNTFDKALKSVSVDGEPLRTANDCVMAIHAIELSNARHQCSIYWEDLLVCHGVPDFSSVGDSLDAWIEVISRYLDWFQNEFDALRSMMDVAGIPFEAVFQTKPLESDQASVDRLLEAIREQIPAVVRCCLSTIDRAEAEEALAAAAAELQRGENKGSLICRQLLSALESEDLIAYTERFEELVTLHTKFETQTRREAFLRRLMPVAPQWAEAIRSREGIHGSFSVPSTIEDAWRWKQYAGVLSEIAKEPYDALQARSIELSRRYREVTAQFAEEKAWYHLLARTERDIDMKQALQGWKLTVKKIGRGTGKSAPMYKAQARKLMAKCQQAVPAWIMPVNKALESLNPRENRFDIVIVDEASQSDICSLAITYMAQKLIVVGDDKQVSPMAIGTEESVINSLIKEHLDGVIPNAHLYRLSTSLYDIASMTFQPLMLKEHFRCVPEIIGFSNQLSYDYKIKPLRDASNSHLLPAMVSYRVPDGFREESRDENPEEAKAIVALLRSAMEQPEYAGKTFGVISMLGSEQAVRIQSLIYEHVEPKEIESRRILCGNAANFQGDERDVVFLSLVQGRPERGQLPSMGYGVDDANRKRFNVAASRAKDQLWIVHSLDAGNDLKPGDLRRSLIEYAIDPTAFEQVLDSIHKHSESPFEIEVAKALTARGYRLVQQWKVGAYRLDMVAVSGSRTVAIECDGERWHSGVSKIREDLERQTILERIGWRFIRIRGSEFYRNSEKTVERVVKELEAFGISPESPPVSEGKERTSELLERTKLRAMEFLRSIGKPGSGAPDFRTIAFALDSNASEKKEPDRMVQRSPVSEPIRTETVEKPEEAPTYDRTGSGLKERSVSRDAVSVTKEWTRNPDARPTQPIKPSVTPEPHPVSPPEKARQRPVASAGSVMNSPAPKTGGADSPQACPALALIQSAGVEFVDKRPSGGSLWIVGSQELLELVKKCKSHGVHFTFAPEGGKATKHRPGWWSKEKKA